MKPSHAHAQGGTAALRVGFEASDALNGHRAIGRYVRELPLALLRTTPETSLDLRLLCFGRHATDRAAEYRALLDEAGAASLRAIPVPGKLFHLFWNRVSLPRVERFLGPLDVLHAPSFLTPPAHPRTRTILTMHGIVNFVRPDLLPQNFVAELATLWDRYLRRADWLVSVSETARRDFLERFDFPADRIRAIPLGVGPGFVPRPEEEVARLLEARFGSRGVKRPYVLFVGGLQRVKNLANLLHAFTILVERHRLPHRLVLVGEMQDGANDIHAALRHPALADRIVTTGHVDGASEDLPLLYCGARLLAQPSLYEGWASPPLEAMASGTPVVASSISSLPETCGDAALFADPTDPDAWAEAMLRLIEDEGLHAALRQRGLAWSRRWTWDRCARATWDLYREAAQSGPRPSPRRVGSRLPPPLPF